MSKKIIKLAILLPAVVGLSLLLIATGYKLVRYTVVEEQKALVHSIAQNILPALLVNDTVQVQAALKALEEYPGVESAELIGAQGASIASYSRGGAIDDNQISTFELASASEDLNQVYLTAPITFDSLIVANLHIAVNLWPSYLKIITWLGIFLIIPSVIYVLIKQFRVKLRFERIEETYHNSNISSIQDFEINKVFKDAILESDITIEYQPIKRLSDGGVFGMEVIVCWRHPSGQTIYASPSDFFDLVDKNNFFVPFERWLFETACSQAAEWQHRYGPLVMSINTTLNQLNNPTFTKMVRSVCEETQFPHQLLEFEISEKLISNSLHNSINRISEIYREGFSTTINCFGLSNDCSEFIKNRQTRKIKIDKNLVKRIIADENVFNLVESIISQVDAGDMQIMADGVDSLEQALNLKNLGCILGQGSYFGSPMSANAFELLLKNRINDSSIKNKLISENSNFSSVSI